MTRNFIEKAGKIRRGSNRLLKGFIDTNHNLLKLIILKVYNISYIIRNFIKGIGNESRGYIQFLEIYIALSEKC